MNKQKLKQAENDFKLMIKNSTEKEIEEVKNGNYGMTAFKWANRYANPLEENETYKKIYNIFYNYFEKLNDKK